jgi:hypothetical protein
MLVLNNDEIYFKLIACDDVEGIYLGQVTDQWRGVMNRRETSWVCYEQDRDRLVVFTTLRQVAGCYEQERDQLGAL